jgi:hypothetical protein
MLDKFSPLLLLRGTPRITWRFFALASKRPIADAPHD